MPIKIVGGSTVVTPMQNKRQFDESGVIMDDDFFICDRQNIGKQIAWNVNPTSTGQGIITVQVDAAGDQTINLSTLSANQSNSFATIQPDAGTSPVASTSTDTLTLTGVNVTITGNSGTNTITLTLPTTATKTVLTPATVALGSGTAIDWTLGSTFSKTLSANTTFTFSGALDGQTIVVSLTNTASNYTVTWPTVSWSGGSAPTQTTGAKTDIYTFIKIGSTYYGSAIQNF